MDHIYAAVAGFFAGLSLGLILALVVSLRAAARARAEGGPCWIKEQVRYRDEAP